MSHEAVSGVESSAVAVVINPSGNDDVDALLFGGEYLVDHNGVTTTLTYSFPDINSQFSADANGGYEIDNSEPYSGLAGLSTSGQAMFERALASLSLSTNLLFEKVADEGESAGTIRVAFTTFEEDSETVAFAYLPSSVPAASDIWVYSSNHSEDDTDFQHTLLHELGHAVGLKHPHEAMNEFPAMNTELDGLEWTVMSYNVSARYSDALGADLYPQSYMYYDILALQYLYGVNQTATVGNDSYVYDLGERYFLTIWDTAGTDTLGVENGSTDVFLDLTPGSWSNVGTTIKYFSATETWEETETVYIPPEVTIENAYGASGDDTLIGNDAANNLTGNAGGDFLEGHAGDDVLRPERGSDIALGGIGDDSVWAGGEDAGNDIVVGGGGNDILAGGGGDDFIIGGGADDGDMRQILRVNEDSASDGDDTLYGGSGNDTLLGVGWDDAAVTDNGAYDAGEALTSGAGTDQIWAGAGNDMLVAGAGADALGGGPGDDTVYAGAGDDTIYGGRQDASDTGTNDQIFAEAGNDVIFSSGGNDSIEGGSGNDNIFSGDGQDTVKGGAGADTLWGGADDDLFVGGGGSADTFIFEVGHGDDRITDFNVSADILVLAQTSTDFQSVSDVQAAATTQGGGVLIDTGGGDSLFLGGVSLSEIADINYQFS